MRRLMLGAVLSAAFGALALDNTVNNDFWNTTAYVNAQPVTSAATVTCPLDTAVRAEVVTTPASDFNSRNPGVTIIIR